MLPLLQWRETRQPVAHPNYCAFSCTGPPQSVRSPSICFAQAAFYRDGSAILVHAPLRMRLIDEYRFLVEPFLMGQGKRNIA
jgi:hypothetical protein